MAEAGSGIPPVAVSRGGFPASPSLNLCLQSCHQTTHGCGQLWALCGFCKSPKISQYIRFLLKVSYS